MAKIIRDAIKLGSFILCNLRPIHLNILYPHLDERKMAPSPARFPVENGRRDDGNLCLSETITKGIPVENKYSCLVSAPLTLPRVSS